jgi:hypothetical protein
MNCKPGDLAFIVHAGIYAEPWAEGLVVRCIDSFAEGSYVCWNIERPLVSPVGQVFTSVYDGVLRPIGNPGEDAQDETLHWLPVPSQHKEVA